MAKAKRSTPDSPLVTVLKRLGCTYCATCHAFGAGYRAYMVVVGRQAVVHISEGKQWDWCDVPRVGGAR
jgi:hypothetical protein